MDPGSRPGFADYHQVLNVLRLASFLGIVAAGQTLVLIAGNEGIDLSVGAVVTLSAVIVHGLVHGSNTLILPALVLALVAGASVGLVNGIAISKLRIPPLVMTLACIAHKSLEIFERCRLWQQNSPATPDYSAAFSERTISNSLF
jgi:ribose/xylose/arabinose/galactoside ABC-type transport system permease subunit